MLYFSITVKRIRDIYFLVLEFHIEMIYYLPKSAFILNDFLKYGVKEIGLLFLLEWNKDYENKKDEFVITI